MQGEAPVTFLDLHLLPEFPCLAVSRTVYVNRRVATLNLLPQNVYELRIGEVVLQDDARALDAEFLECDFAVVDEPPRNTASYEYEDENGERNDFFVLHVERVLVLSVYQSHVRGEGITG